MIVDEFQKEGIILPPEFIAIFERVEKLLPNYRPTNKPGQAPVPCEPNYSAMRELWNQTMINRLIPDQSVEITPVDILYRCLWYEAVALAEMLETEIEPTATVILTVPAGERLEDLSEFYGTTSQIFTEALLHYASSIQKRPGSWEANAPFSFDNYDPHNENAAADRWF